MIINKLTAPASESEIKSYWKHVDKVYISVVCITFNQESYISDAIDSFLAQKTEYRFEIIIHDDCSTDNTRDVLLAYKEKYPSIIKLVLQETNQYSLGKKITPLAVEYAVGDYIALCEGDDYWIDCQKLQKQIDIFYCNKDAVLVHSKSFDLDVKNNVITQSAVPNKINTFETLVNENRIHTLTSMFKKELAQSFYKDVLLLEENMSWKMGDLPLWFYLAMRGSIIMLDDITSVYRILEESASHSKCKEKNIEFGYSGLLIRSYFLNSGYPVDFKLKRNFSNKLLKFYCFNNKKIKFKYIKGASYYYLFCLFLLRGLRLNKIAKIILKRGQ